MLYYCNLCVPGVISEMVFLDAIATQTVRELFRKWVQEFLNSFPGWFSWMQLRPKCLNVRTL